MFTTQDLITAPRSSPAVANDDGSYLMFTESRYDIDTRKTTTCLKTVKIQVGNELGEDEVVLDRFVFSDPSWIPNCNSDICYLTPSQSGNNVCIVNIHSKKTYVAAEINASVENLKLCSLRDGHVALVVSGLLGSDGNLYNEATAIKSSSGRIFDTARVHSWDRMIEEQKYSLWFNQLVYVDGIWKLEGELFNLLPNSTLEAPLGVYDLYDPQDNFDVCESGVAFTATNRERTAFEPEQVSFAYFTPLASFRNAPTREPFQIQPPGLSKIGASTNIRISPDAKQIAFLLNDYDDPCNNKIIVSNFNGGVEPQIGQFLMGCESSGSIDPPIAFEFYQGSGSFLLQRLQAGQVIISTLQQGSQAEDVLKSTNISGLSPKGNDRSAWVITASSFVERVRWTLFDVCTKQSKILKSTQRYDAVQFGLSTDMVSEFCCETEEAKVHSWMLRPRDFDERGKYPWIMMPHGGPESAWMNAWSTRWNPALYAEQGYVVILPDLAGSLGYGIDFTRRAQGDWGGSPLRDIQSVISHVERYNFLDNTKAVLASASFGAYLISWMMGEETIRKFCGIVWHDGRFDMLASSPQCDIFLWDAAFNGTGFSWENEYNLQKYNPARPERLRNWKNAPPTLVIHGEKDYRCPFGEGVATFRTLQRLGVPSRFLVFPDEGHWVMKPANALFWMDSIIDWMRRCVNQEFVNNPSRR